MNTAKAFDADTGRYPVGPPELPLPIRVDFWHGDSLHRVGVVLESDPAPVLPAFVPFDFRRRVADNRLAVRQTYFSLLAEVARSGSVTPAAEWLLDNYHVVDENFRHLRRDLDWKVYRALPGVTLAGGDDVPRTLALAWTHVAVTNSELTVQGLTDVVQGFQTEGSLTIGEVWAVPAVLRFVLLENLRRLSDRIERSRQKRGAANDLADRLERTDPTDMARVLMPHAVDTQDRTFAAQLFYRLRDGSALSDQPLRWLESRIAAGGTTPDQVIAAEHAQQSTGNVTVGNIIRSLRLIDEIDWLAWFESVSRVEAVLRQGRDYGLLDKPTRNSYRDTVERIARRSAMTEAEVAGAAIAGLVDGVDVGVPLVGAGLPLLERLCGYRPSLRERAIRAYRRLDWVGIAAPMVLGTLFLAVVMAAAPIAATPGRFFLLLLLAALPASEVAVALVNFAGARLLPPKRLPAYDFTNAIPDTARTIVVMPCLLSGHDEIDDLVRNLELHYLANPGGAVSFALLSDWVDHEAETRDSDAALLDHARTAIDTLAATYARTGARRFFLLHRRRLYNPSEGAWMGWERKRGKIVELNQLLRGDDDTSFLSPPADLPQGIRFVVTLDADTRLPRGSVARLVGKMAHPVNRAVLNASSTGVAGGYGLMQPRVTPSLTTGDQASLFQRVFSTNRGLDPYVFTVSDLYQDLLGAGSFTGKGIYDIDAFAAATAGRIAENTVLSHDLLEGALARTALVTDVEVVEDFPVQYHVDAARQHRWTRGDWQLLPYILSRSNGLDGLARLKMIDNLRRSLVPVLWVAASVAGWLLLPIGDVARWQGLLVIVLLSASALSFLAGVTPNEPSVSALRHLRVVGTEALGHLAGFVLRLAFLAHQASVMVDAIGRTGWRMMVSRAHLLEWRTASQVAAGGARSPLFYLRLMVASPVLALVVLAALSSVNPAALVVAGPILTLWLVAPLLAWAISQTLETEDGLHIRPADAADLRAFARITWRYFETFVTAEQHHLPPDNFQDTPDDKIAERTSPTNIGLYLLSVLTARDFGWISLTSALDRIGATIATVESLEKYNGHLFNWYDTRSLAVMQPRYVSSVDSGNLAGHLITVSSALKEWARNSVVHVPADPRGVGDVLAVLRRHIDAIPQDRRSLRPLRRRVEERALGFEKTFAVYLAEPQLAAVRGINLTIIARDIHALALSLAAELDSEAASDLVWWAGALQATCEVALSDAASDRHALEALRIRMDTLAERVRALAFAMDFAFLLNPQKRLLSVGFRADTAQLDESCYDLLASEARLASFFAIAKGDVPNEHWFRLGRPQVVVGFTGALLSWSGSMFEYLMPPLVMHERVGGVLHQSNAAAVRRQMDHGARNGTPWGVSESAFNARDRALNYQYYAFGVPSLGLKRARAEDLVIAPYASALACQIRPRDAVVNLHRLAAMGALGRHGFFDAVDMTPARVPEGATFAVVRNVMAHHQGMVIVAVANAVLAGIHRDRFHDDPVVQAAELLLQEKAPREIVPITRPVHAEGAVTADSDQNQIAQTTIADPGNAPRAVGLFSNGRYARMLTATGAGYSRIGARDITRWRPDPTQDRGGMFVFLRDAETQAWWSATTAPKPAHDEQATTIFSDHKAEFLKTVGRIETHLEVIVASEADAEGARLTIRNHGTRARSIEVTSYGEIVLDDAASDRAHPAFSKMFVRTSIARQGRVITATRNRRTPGDAGPHLAHLICGPDDGRGVQAETDRRAFIGRGRDLPDAAAFDPQARLSGSDGFTLDPIFALRQTVRIAPGKEVTLTFWTVVAQTASALEDAVAHYANPATYDHEHRLAWTRSQIELRHMDSSLEEVAVFRQLARYVIYPDVGLSAQDGDIRAALGPQSSLWALGISGDHPIIALRIDTETDVPIIRKALRMMEYFRHHGVLADLVILNDRASSYTQDLQNQLVAMCDAADRLAPPGTPRRVFALRRDQMSAEGWNGLLAAARIVLHTRNGTLSQQLARVTAALTPVPAVPATTTLLRQTAVVQTLPAEPFRFWNGYGGFSESGTEYVVRLHHRQQTPAPWVNVIGRDDFGFHVSAEGAGFTWAVNSRDYQITPWSNDPVSNPVSEAFFVRDQRTGLVATPFAALSSDPSAVYETRHGLGQSRFTVQAGWIGIEAVQTLATAGPAKLTRLRLTNPGATTLHLDCSAYVELVLGNNRMISAPTIRARFDRDLNAVLAQNPFNTDFPGRVTALACDRPVTAHTLSRRAYLGGAATLADAALRVATWANGTDPDADGDPQGDPCAAILTTFSLPPGGSAEVTFVLADAPSDDIAGVIRSACLPGGTSAALAQTGAGWRDVLDTLQVQTPDAKFDLMVNTWLPYQCLSCRIRARSAFYQASGAFGFRDQLQDTSAMILHDASLARTQILNAAGRQFVEGDVQHWWLPATGAGVRTTISDDVVWLASATARYVKATGDIGILDAPLPYLAGAMLEPGHSDAFFQPGRADLVEPLYEHCARALDLAIARTGARGLPLMLGGDWNDGMNRVGAAGQGESVWLGWFLCATLDDFMPFVLARGDRLRAKGWAVHRAAVATALDAAGWDGGWYRRGYFDDGTPLGSAEAAECRIDSIAQSWAVISGAGDPARASVAVDAALAQLQDREAGIMRLFTPPFEATPQDPGYIKAYPPGVRENGGQYTHAAAWMVYALARMGRGEAAHDLFDKLNPISHALTRPAADRYRVEPYVVAADIYGAGDKSGRGGWTWYTGSAGWLYRAAVEGILGITLEGGTSLRIVPALPDDWPGYTATLRHAGRLHRITVRREPVGTGIAATPRTGLVVQVDGQQAGADGTFDLAGPAQGHVAAEAG